MAKPSPKPKPITQNPDGSLSLNTFLGETQKIPEQNMSPTPIQNMSPTKTKTKTPPISSVWTPGISPIFPWIPNSETITFTPDTAKKIQERDNKLQEIPDSLGLLQPDEDSYHVKALDSHFQTLKQAGQLELNDTQKSYIQRFKAKYPEYEPVDDTILYAKVIQADPKTMAKYGNIQDQRPLLVKIAEDGWKVISDTYNQYAPKVIAEQNDRNPIRSMRDMWAWILHATAWVLNETIYNTAQSISPGALQKWFWEQGKTLLEIPPNVLWYFPQVTSDFLLQNSDPVVIKKVGDKMNQIIDNNPEVAQEIANWASLWNSVLEIAPYLGMLEWATGDTAPAILEQIKADSANIGSPFKKAPPPDSWVGIWTTKTGESFIMETKPGVINNLRDRFFAKPQEDLAFRAVTPRENKALSVAQKTEAGARSLESLEQIYSDARTGKTSADVSTMQGALEGLQQSKEYWGSKIGELTQGKEIVPVADIAESLKQSLTDPKTKLNPNLRWLANTVIEVLWDEKYTNGISINELQSVISDIKGQIFSDHKNVVALAKETAGKALSSFLDELGNRFNSAVENATWDVKGLQEAKKAYSKVIRIEKDLANSYLVQERSVKGGLSNLAGTTIAIAELLKDPTPGGIIRSVAIKTLLNEIGKAKSRGGSYEALIRAMDREALLRKPWEYANPSVGSNNLPDSKMGERPGQVNSEGQVNPIPDVTPGKSLAATYERGFTLKNGLKDKEFGVKEMLADYEKLSPEEQVVARENPAVKRMVKYDEIGKEVDLIESIAQPLTKEEAFDMYSGVLEKVRHWDYTPNELKYINQTAPKAITHDLRNAGNELLGRPTIPDPEVVKAEMKAQKEQAKLVAKKEKKVPVRTQSETDSVKAMFSEEFDEGGRYFSPNTSPKDLYNIGKKIEEQEIGDYEGFNPEPAITAKTIKGIENQQKVLNRWRQNRKPTPEQATINDLARDLNMDNDQAFQLIKDMYEGRTPSIEDGIAKAEAKMEADYTQEQNKKAEAQSLQDSLQGYVAGKEKFRTAQDLQKTQLTTKILKQLGDRETVSKEFIQNLTKAPGISATEAKIITDLLDGVEWKVNVADFKSKVEAELLPLKRSTPKSVRNDTGDYKYENISLPDDIKWNVDSYRENIYESPISTSAWEIHFSWDTKNYFWHTRIEDMADGSTRRVIEVQSDLYQKGNLERELNAVKPNTGKFDSANKQRISNLLPEKEAQEYNDLWQGIYDGQFDSSKRIWDKWFARFAELEQLAEKSANNRMGASKLSQYSDPTAHFRMVREEIAKAAEDWKTKLQFPTGETAMKVEGLWQQETVWLRDFQRKWETGYTSKQLKPDNMEVGIEIVRWWWEWDINFMPSDKWIITEVLWDGKFKAVPKRIAENADITNKDTLSILNSSGNAETFDISWKVDTSNPIYKFYEKDVQKYLKNKYDAKLVTDDKWVSWMQVDVKPEMAIDVEAFRSTLENKLGTTITPKQVTEIQKLNKQLFWDENVEILQQILSNKDALGSYKDGMIKIIEGQAEPKDTYLHEAVHKYLDSFTSEAEHLDILEAGKKKYKLDDLSAVEEKIAEDFIKYAKDRKWITGVLKTHFENIINKIKQFFGKMDKVDNLYNELSRGKAKKVSGKVKDKWVEKYNPKK